MAKKKTSIYDPKYAARYGNIGQSMGRSSSEDLRAQARAQSEAGVYYNPEYSSGYAQTGGDYYYQPDTVKSLGNIDSEESWYDKATRTVGQLAYDVYKAPGDLWNFDWTSAWNLGVKKQIQASLGNEEEQLRDLKTQEQELKDFSQFVDKYNQYKDDLLNLQIAEKNGNSVEVMRLQNKIQNDYDGFQDSINYYKQAIKTDPILQQVMYKSATGDRMYDTKLGAKVLYDAWVHTPNSKNDKWLSNIFTNAGIQLGNLAEFFFGNPSAETHTRRAIARGSLDTEDLKKLQNYDLDHIKGPTYNLFKTDIKNRVNNLQKDISEKETAVKDKIYLYQKGSWFYNPQKINKQFEEKNSTNKAFSDLYNEGINSILYSLPELGSSFSSFGSFMSQLGIQYIGSSAAQYLSKEHPMAAMATMLATQLGSFATAYKMRQDETNSEAMGAYLQRVQSDAINNKINLNRILNLTKRFLNSQGVYTDGLNEQDLLQAALAYNIQTNDKEFEKIKRNARKGVNKLKAQNNALSYIDYLEVLPFAGNAGSIIKNSVNDVAKNIAYKKSLKYTADDVLEATEKLAENSISSQAKRKLSQSWISNKIDKVLAGSGMSIEKQIAARNLLHSLGDYNKKMAITAVAEGLEEGQQAFLQDRYKRGEYDETTADYDYGRGIDVNSLVDNTNLAFQSALAYYGLNFGDPLNGDESLKQQMEAGAATSFWFGLGHQALANIKNDDISVRNWVNQYKHDKNLMRYVANNYKQQQDDVHVGMFFDSFKNGNNAERIKRSYDAFKYLKNNDAITDQDIDDDVKLAQIAYDVYRRTNNKKDTTLDELNINRNSEDHKEFVKQASRVIFDVKNVAELAQRSGNNLENSINQIIKRVVENEESSDELSKSFNELVARTHQKDALSANNSILEIDKKIEELNKKYKSPKVLDPNRSEEEKKKEEQSDKEYNERYEELKEQRKQAQDRLELSEKDYKERIVRTLLLQKQRAILKGLHSKLENQKDKLASIKKAFGYKLNIESLYGMKNAIQQKIDELDKFLKPILKDGTNEKVLDKYRPLIDDESFNDDVIINALNDSLLKSLSVKYQAYNYGRVNPLMSKFAIPRVKWENLTDDQRINFQNNLIREKQSRGESVDDIDFKKEWVKRNSRINLKMNTLKKKRQDIEDNKGTDRELLPIDEQQQIEDIEKNVANIIIEQDMSDRFQRRQMVRLEKEQNEPLTINDLDNANEGDQKAQEKIINAAEESQESKQDKEDEAPATEEQEGQLDAAQRQIEEARKKIYGERSDELTEEKQKKANRINLTDEDINRMLLENTESVTEAQNNTEEADRQLDIQQEHERKQEIFNKALDLLQDENIDRTNKENVSKYLIDKLGMPKEWADELAELYSKIEPESNEDDSEQLSEDNTQSLQQQEEQQLPQTSDDNNSELSIGDDEQSQMQQDDNESLEIPTETTLENIENLISEDPQSTKNNDVNTSTGEEKDTSLLDDTSEDENKKDEEKIRDDQEKEQDLSEPSESTTYLKKVIDNIKKYTGLDENTAQQIVTEFVNSWASYKSFDDCVDDVRRIIDKINDARRISGNLNISPQQEEYIYSQLEEFYNDFENAREEFKTTDTRPKELDMNKFDSDDDGTLIYDGKQIDDSLTIGQSEDEDYSNDNLDENKTEAAEGVLSSIGNPFNYQPDSTTPMDYKHNGKVLFANKKMATGNEFNQKVSIPGWFNTVKKMYYVVSGKDNDGKGVDADDLTVALIIEDPDDNSTLYNVAMRTPSDRLFKKGGSSYLSEIIRGLKLLNVDEQKYNNLKQIYISAEVSAYNVSNGTELSETQWKSKNIDRYNKIDEMCRLQSGINGARVFTTGEIEQYIQKLREQRLQIIEAYCTKTKDGKYVIPDVVREDVVPEQVIITNGKLNNQRNDINQAQTRSIYGEDAGFGLGSLISDISDELITGKVQLGVGTGPLGVSPGPNRIRPINGAVEELPGTGKAGKIYIEVPAQNQPGTNKKQVFAQLSEQKFSDNLIPDEDTVQEHFNTDGIADLKTPPSLGEIAFRLILHKIDKSSVTLGVDGLNITGLSDENIDTLADILINHGKQTLIGIIKRDRDGVIKPSSKNAFLSKKLGFYSDKQIAYIEHDDGTSSFYIGDHDENGDQILKEYKISDFFPGENATEEEINRTAYNRRHVIALIERNMHWNTNVDQMMSVNKDLYNILDTYFFENGKRKILNGGLVQTFNPFGNNDFSFDYDDFYNQDGSKKNIIQAAWMIKNNKLVTDVGTNQNDMFYGPFVFAKGIKQNAKPIERENIPTKSKEKETAKKAEAIIIKSNKKEIKKEGPKALFVIPNDEAYKKISVDKEHGGSRYLITATTVGKSGKELSWNKSNPDKLRQVILNKLEELEKSGIKIDNNYKDILNKQKRFVGFNVYMSIRDDNTAGIYIDNQQKATTVSGVYSEIGGEGSVNTDAARSWLQTALGLPEQQVLVTGALLRSITDQAVYGAVRLAVSAINDEVFGYIEMSKQGNKGLEYHEAWHYVNLLLHNRAARIKIYEEYRSKHPELKGAQFKDIEEALAEDFKSYMLGYEDRSRSARIKRFFKYAKNVILSFIGKQDVIYEAYRRIKKGKYRGTKLDTASVEEFRRNYPDGVYFEIPGLTEGQSDFKHISNYHQYYQCAKMLCNKVMEGLDLTSADKIKNYSKKDFDIIFESIKEQIKADPESESSLLLQDVLDNKDAFFKTVSTMLKTFSIDVKRKKKKLDKSVTEGKDTSDVADNIWDIDHMEISKKINVGFKAKLFFSTIPDYTVTLDENGERVYIPSVDPVFGSQNYVSFSRCWNKIMSELWSCDSFDAIDDDTGQYTRTSLAGMVERLNNSGDKFFHAVYEKILPLIDIDDESMSPEQKLEIKTQLLNTIQSSKNRISVLSIDKPFIPKKKVSQEQLQMNDDAALNPEQTTAKKSKSSDVVIDIQKAWRIQDSEYLQSKYILARNWSENLLSGTGIVETDPKTGNNRISKVYLDNLERLIDKARVTIAVPKTQAGNANKGGKYYSIEQAKAAMCSVLNYMGIPADGQVLQQLMDSELSLYPDKYPEINITEKQRHILREFLIGKGSATIQKLYSQLKNAKSGLEIKVGNKDKSLADFYKGYSKVSSTVKGKKVQNPTLPWIGKLTVAYAKTYPSSAEMSVTGANGAQIYPINQNNACSDFLRNLKNNTDNFIEDKKATSYTRSSVLVKNAEHDRVNNTPEEETLHLNTFVALKDEESGNSGDYMQITPMEDYLSKFIMTFNKHLVFPTMADKKTWYSITSKWLENNINTDLLIYNDKNSKISEETINIFASYLSDELNSLKEYYSKENVKALMDNQNMLLVNFHGKVTTEEWTLPSGKPYKYIHFDFSGNGGKFRYFYDVLKVDGLNLNQQLELQYKRELAQNKWYVEHGLLDNVTDGFEFVRNYLDGLLPNNPQQKEFKDSVKALRNGIEQLLKDRINDELNQLNDDPNIKLINKIGDHLFNNGIPNHILKIYENSIHDNLGITDQNILRDGAIYSAVANHVIREIMSIIEVEKIFSGDPAMYKWIEYKSKDLPESVIESITKTETIKTINSKGKVSDKNVKIQVSLLQSKDVDKIKRLGAVLSPGTNQKTQWSDEEKEIIGDFGTSKYTFINVGDIKAVSNYVETIKSIFKQNEVVQILRRSFTDDYVIKNFSTVVGLDPKKVKNVNEVYYTIYKDFDNSDKIINALKNTKGYEQISYEIEKRVSNSVDPYESITVADAQVCLRPAMYRKLRIANGEWTFEEDETGYSDEKAYNMMENDDDWMSNPEKYEICRKLSLKPLKMSYFSNSVTKRIGAYNISLPVYNKMAMFPMFKYVCQSTTGKALYERMNQKGNELDMVGFDSAVKVGCNQNMYTPYKKGVTNLEEMDFETLALPSNTAIDYKTGKIRESLPSEKTLAVQIQDMNDLHLQLNTDAHEADERSVGSQMMKLCFSNVIPDMRYGKHSQEGRGRLGKNIRNDIMNIINAMTQIGANRIYDKYFNKDKDGNYTTLKRNKVQEFVLQVCQNNDLGLASEEIIRSGGKVASLTSRQVFEQSISSMVNKEVIDVNTNGGAAIQQSIFGFVGNSNRNVISENALQNINVLSTKIQDLDLSVRLLKLLEPVGETINDILKNKKLVKQRLGKKMLSEFEDLLDNLNLTWDDYIQENQIDAIEQTEKYNHVLNNGEELKWYNGKGTMEVMLSLNFFRTVIPEKYKTDYKTQRQYLIDHDIIKGVKTDGTQSNPDPFGVGYRIPTQGMSSTFGFVVADVLPETSSDTIIVPTEFTAQTGSDFDVDKLYLATYSYKIDGDNSSRYSTSQKSDMKYNEYLAENENALRNKLLDNYIDIISDYKNTSDARASIDVLTSKLKKEIIPYLSDNAIEYAPSMYELLPSFQARRKMEYSTGKSGIGPFALNVTNLAMTQAVSLKMKFGKDDKLLTECFDFKNIDSVVGNDGEMISAWLSAMVNAHVDVAKDPYILNLNVNSATYKYTNFLLRTGQGMATFTFLAQPVLKRMSNMIISAKGMYGNRLGNDVEIVSRTQRLQYENEIRRHLTNEMLRGFYTYANAILSSEQCTEDQRKYIEVLKKHIDILTFKTGNKKYSITNIKDLYKDYNFKLLDVFVAKRYLKKPDPTDLYNSMLWYMYQACALYFIGNIHQPAQLLSDLVTNSRIDTKKFGNNIISQMNFLNNYNTFKNSDLANKYFYIDDGKEHKELPMYTYFERTFLDKKLRLATKLTKGILKDQTFTSTPLFGRIFNSTMASIFGEVIYDVPKGFDDDGKILFKTQFGYEKVMNDDQVQSVGKALESIYRHRAFLSYRNKIDDESLEIDLSMNGDENAVRNKLTQLLYGDGKKKSIARRVSILKALLKQKVSEKITNQEEIPDWLSELCDDSGQITNEFLNYLNPILDKTGNFVDKILLASSSMDTDSQYKSELQSAFDQLLSIGTTSTQQEDVNFVKAIRELAKDLVFYAYYTTYNNGGVNQFFELVPPKYRKNYDDSIKSAITKSSLNNKLIAQTVLKNNAEIDDFGAFDVLNILDVLCKNFWKDEKIVPTYTRMKKNQNWFSDKGEFVVEKVPKDCSLEGLYNIPIVIALPANSNNDNAKCTNKPYIKIQYGKAENRKTFLFQKIGVQNVIRKDQKTEKETSYPFKYVYKLTNKLGLQDGKNKQYEFVENHNTSIFSDNNVTIVDQNGDTKPLPSVNEEELQKKLNVTKNSEEGGFLKSIGKNVVRLTFEQYRPLTLDEIETTTSSEQLQSDLDSEKTVAQNAAEENNVDLSIEETTNTSVQQQDEQQQNGESQQEQTDVAIDVNDEVSDGLLDNIIDVSQFPGLQDFLSDTSSQEEQELSEQDKKESEERKNDCKSK